MTSIACDRCESSKETAATRRGMARLPRGWSRHQGAIWCAKCWDAAYLLRAITIPVAGPVSGDWPAFRAALAAAWSQSTCLANWAVSQLLRAEAPRMPGDAKLPPAPKLYLYPAARSAFPELSTAAVVSVLNSVERRYRKARYQAVWLSSDRPPVYRYPMPYPLSAACWKVSQGDGGQWLLSLPLGGERWTIRLRGGHQFARQLAAVRKLLAGEAVPGELAIYRVRASGGDHRPGVEGRGGDTWPTWRIMAKLVMYLPRPPARERSGTLHVRTGAEAIVTALDEEREKLWTYNAEHARTWLWRHRQRLDALSEDAKAEFRRPKRRRRALDLDREKLVAKQHHRMDTLLHQISAALVGFARRRGYASVAYDDSDHSWHQEFPWYRLRELVRQKLSAEGIELASGEMATETPDPLAAS